MLYHHMRFYNFKLILFQNRHRLTDLMIMLEQFSMEKDTTVGLINHSILLLAKMLLYVVKFTTRVKEPT